jgi:hypothetical protein
MRAVPARPSRELDPISAMSWGVEPVRRDQQGKSTIRIRGVYAIAGEIARQGIHATNGRLAIIPNSQVLRGCRHDPDDFTRRVCENFSLAARFNVTRIIQFCARDISLFETMRAAMTTGRMRR